VIGREVVMLGPVSRRVRLLLKPWLLDERAANYALVPLVSAIYWTVIYRSTVWLWRHGFVEDWLMDGAELSRQNIRRALRWPRSWATLFTGHHGDEFAGRDMELESEVLALTGKARVIRRDSWAHLGFSLETKALKRWRKR